MPQTHDIEVSNPATGLDYVFVITEEGQLLEIFYKHKLEKVYSVCSPHLVPEDVQFAYEKFKPYYLENAVNKKRRPGSAAK